MTYQRLSEDLLIGGVAVRDRPVDTDASRKAVKEARKDSVALNDFRRVVESAASQLKASEEGFEKALQKRLADHRGSVDFTEEIVKRLGPEIRSTLGQFHDYRALAGRVTRNVGVFLEGRFPGLTIDEQLDQAPHEITAAYWAAILMIDKFDTALILLEPDLIDRVAYPPFRFHGLATKYLKIYQREFEERSLNLVVRGESYGKVRGNSKAIAVIPHALLDNAAKYALAGSDVVVSFDEDRDSVIFSVQTLGPKVLDSERTRIFEPFFRGKAAKAVSAEGMGFGLAACQLVAHRLNTRVVLEQERSPAVSRYFRTTFSVEIPKHRQ